MMYSKKKSLLLILLVFFFAFWEGCQSSDLPETLKKFSTTDWRNCSTKDHKIDGLFGKDWESVEFIAGRFGYIYIDFNCRTQTLYLLNDWVHRNDAPIGQNCYNLFYVNCGRSGLMEIKVHANQTISILLNGKELDPKVMKAKGASGFSSSPNMKEKHAIFEMKFSFAKPLSDNYCRMMLKDPGPTFPNCSDPKKSLTTEPNTIHFKTKPGKFSATKSIGRPLVAGISSFKATKGSTFSIFGLSLGEFAGKVQLGPHQAKILSWEPDEVKIKLPETTGRFQVLLTTSDGKYDRLDKFIEITEPTPPCTPNCKDKDCGKDGCGGTCGQCKSPKTCNDGVCKAPCTPNCKNKQCGEDGCGGTCGTCPKTHICEVGQCELKCKPDCEGKKCGADGCGGYCGHCDVGQYCSEGICKKG
mgnify:CR=1 FL=1